MNPEVNLLAPPPAYDENRIESQQRSSQHITDRYKIMRRQMIALGISIGTNIILAFLLGLIIIDPLYNRQWIKRMPD